MRVFGSAMVSLSKRCTYGFGWRLGLSFVLVCCGMLLWSGGAVAQSDADRATARALAKEGHGALIDRDHATAEDRFRRADVLVHSPLLVIDHARALIGLGRYVEAQERLASVLREEIPESAPKIWHSAPPLAKELLAEVEPKVAWLTIVIEGPEQPEVTLDGKPVPAVALGVRRAADPGTREIVVTADGWKQKAAEVSLSEGGEETLTLVLEVDPEAKRSQGRIPSVPKASSAAAEPPRSRVPLYIALGVGGAGLGLGAVTGLFALQNRSALKEDCVDGVCPQSSQSEIDDYHRNGTLSGIGFGLGIAGLATGLVFYLTEERSGAPDLGLSVGPSSVMLGGAF